MHERVSDGHLDTLVFSSFHFAVRPRIRSRTPCTQVPAVRTYIGLPTSRSTSLSYAELSIVFFSDDDSRPRSVILGVNCTLRDTRSRFRIVLERTLCGWLFRVRTALSARTVRHDVLKAPTGNPECPLTVSHNVVRSWHFIYRSRPFSFCKLKNKITWFNKTRAYRRPSKCFFFDRTIQLS